jgi:DNA integrity scanning protein DisA with diadenylate cyclase activity
MTLLPYCFEVVIQMATNALMMWVGLVIFLLLFAILLRMKLEHIESLLNAILKQLPASP